MKYSNHTTIGVFDSGAGGLSVANAIAKAYPDHKIIYRDDKEHVPYGSREPEEIFGFVIPIFQQMIDEGCTAIVIACNSVTTTLIGTLRERLPIPLVGIEPMVKPASEITRSGVIAVCATPLTLSSPRYEELKRRYARNIRVIEPDCSDWAFMIEHDSVDDDIVKQRIDAVISQGADVIVLACTHYHWIEDTIVSLSDGKATVLQPEQPIIEQLGRVLSTIL